MSFTKRAFNWPHLRMRLHVILQLISLMRGVVPVITFMDLVFLYITYMVSTNLINMLHNYFLLLIPGLFCLP